MRIRFSLNEDFELTWNGSCFVIQVNEAPKYVVL